MWVTNVCKETIQFSRLVSSPFQNKIECINILCWKTENGVFIRVVMKFLSVNHSQLLEEEIRTNYRNVASCISDVPKTVYSVPYFVLFTFCIPCFHLRPGLHVSFLFTLISFLFLMPRCWLYPVNDCANELSGSLWRCERNMCVKYALKSSIISLLHGPKFLQ
jgi:hypothetical protein